MRRWLTLLVALCILAPAVGAQVPQDAQRYKRDLIRNARLVWGLDAPISTFAAQIEQESGWKPGARSYVGAVGLAQFMPETASWIAGIVPALASNEPTNPIWAIRALVEYDKWIYDRVTGANHCERMAKALSGYNGGMGWVQRDEKLAASKGYNPAFWFDNVERVNAGRKDAFWQENRGYPKRILRKLEPNYAKADWGIASCLVITRE